MSLLDDPQVRGIWSDTLFPMLKDLIGYGADALQGDTLEEWVDAALDTTLVTLSAIAPELAPGMVALRNAVNTPVHNVADQARRAIKQWSIGRIDTKRHLSFGDHQQCEQPTDTAVDRLFM